MKVGLHTSKLRRMLLLTLAAATATAGSAQTNRSAEFATALVLDDRAPHLGDAIRVSLNARNNADKELSAEKSATAFDCFEVTAPDGQAATYVGFMGQVMANPLPVSPRGTVTLAEHLDLTDKYILQKPGRYSVRFKGGVSGLPDSNTITIDVSPGQLTELDKAVIQLLPIRPKGWYVTKSAHSQKEVTPFGRPAVVGYDAHICRDYMRGEAVYVWLTKAPTENDPQQNPPVKSEYLGRSQGLYVYVAVASATPALWPNAIEEVARALQITKD